MQALSPAYGEVVGLMATELSGPPSGGCVSSFRSIQDFRIYLGYTSIDAFHVHEISKIPKSLAIEQERGSFVVSILLVEDRYNRIVEQTSGN